MAPPNYQMIERALKAVAPAPSSGGFGNAMAPYIGPGPSPLVASYGDWVQGHQLPTGGALPREWQAFLSGMMSPGVPIQPVPLDVPKPGEDMPEPRARQMPVSWNLPMGAPGTEGLGKLASFETLRTVCDLYSVARSCIRLRKDELRGIGWDIGPTREAAKAMRGDHRAAQDFASRQAKLIQFFRKPDPNYWEFGTWFTALTEELFTTDAMSVYFQPSRLKRGGVLGSNLAALVAIDGATIRPLATVQGGMPQPPNVAFQQYLWGVPRVDLMALSQGQDLKDTGKDGLVAEYRASQLRYLPFSPRVWTPYGTAFIENALVPVLTGIQKQTYQYNYYDQGSIPGLFISPGDPSLTASQLKILQDALNGLAGDQAWKHKIVVLPGGSKTDPMRPWPLADDFDTLLQIETCMGFDIQPFEIGVIPQLSAAAASSGTARQTVGARVDIRQRKSTIPLLLFLKTAIFDWVIQDICGQKDMEWKWEGLDEDQNIAELTQALVEQVGAGLLSIDEGRQILGREPWNLPITSDPGWATQWGGLVPLTGITEATAQPLGGSPGPGGPGRGARSSPTTIDLSSPGAVAGPGSPAAPSTVPRNRLSTGQRRNQAAQVTSTQNRTGSTGTPAHSGARAHPATRTSGAARKAILGALTAGTAGEFQAAMGAPLWASVPQVIQGEVEKEEASPATPGAAEDAGLAKAARELGLLRSHLARGEPVSAWEPRHISPRLLGQVAEDLAKGMSPAAACERARLSLGASAVKEAERYVTCAQGHKHWGAHGAAGLLIRAKGGDGKWRYLLQRQGDRAGDPGMWGIPGGALHEGEPPHLGAFRETFEELGELPGLRPHHVVTDDHGGPDGGWAYHTVVADAPAMFAPPVNGGTPEETGGWAWLRGREVDSYPLRPGFAQTWPAVRRSQRSKTIKGAGLGGTPVSAETVRRGLLDDYPPEAVAWTKDATWVATDVPMDRIDFGSVKQWSAYHDHKRVQHFARQYRSGQPVNPPVMVQEHGESEINVGDGHHRALGAKDAGKESIRAYVGKVPKGDTRWREMHSSQHRDMGKAAKVPKASVNYREATGEKRCGNCVMFRPDGPHPDPGRCTLVQGLIDPDAVCDRWAPGRAGKSAQTPYVSTVHHPLGHEGLWHTPSKKVPTMQQLPAYHQNTARALMRDHGMSESEAIATAIQAIREWKSGRAFGGKVKVTPQVQAAAARADAEFERLRAAHH